MNVAIDSFVTFEEPYWYVCAVTNHGQLWVRLRSGEPNRIEEGKQELERCLPMWMNWKPRDPSGIIKLNPFGTFVVSPEAQVVNGRHFSATRTKQPSKVSTQYYRNIKRG